MDTSELVKELSYRIDRITLYQEQFNDWSDFLTELKSDIESLEENHDDCYSECQLNEYVAEETSDLRDRIDDLEKQLSKKRISKTKQALQDRIDELEGELSDAKADLNIYRQRIERGATPAKLADMFIFTPEEARAQFRLIEGGAA